MQVKVVKRFFDKSDNMKLRLPEEVMDMDEKRATVLVSHGVAEIVPEKKTKITKREAAE